MRGKGAWVISESSLRRVTLGTCGKMAEWEEGEEEARQ